MQPPSVVFNLALPSETEAEVTEVKYEAIDLLRRRLTRQSLYFTTFFHLRTAVGWFCNKFTSYRQILSAVFLSYLRVTLSSQHGCPL